MNTDRIFVREYLESLTEKNELNVIFPFLLESMGFTILTKPSENLGLKEFGKDVVAVGKDEDGIKKKFYFELKGGNDRDISEKLITDADGIADSLINASIIDDDYSYPNLQDLPLEISIVHNGIVKGNASRLLNETFKRVEKLRPDAKFSRWDIEKLTQLFTRHLFGPYLLSDDTIRKNLNRVLINLDSVQEVSLDFKELVRGVLYKKEWTNKRGRVPRPWALTFETIKLIGFIVYRESVSNNNLGIAEKHVRQLVMDFWYWVLKNKQENRPSVKKYFEEVYALYLHVLTEYGSRVLPIALNKDGLYYPNGGAYEQIGYTLRTHDFISLMIYGLNNTNDDDSNGHDTVELVNQLINQNSVSRRPLLDIHSLPILDVVLLFHKFGRDDLAIHHIREVFGYIKFAKDNSGRIPDASNNPQNIIKLFATGVKPVYYIEETSLLLGLLAELTVIFNLEKDFYNIRDFAIKNSIDLAIFVPHHGEESNSKELIEDLENDLEEQLFSKSFQNGYQSEIQLFDERREKITFEVFKNDLIECKNEFTYQYRSDKAGYEILRDLAHFHFKTPYFPDRWRCLL